MRHQLQPLTTSLQGELHLDEAHRHLYATDASHFEEQPLGVALPRHADDCARLVRHAVTHHIPIIPRGGGTGLCGQTVGPGLVVDCSRYMREMLEFDTDNRLAHVQPGLIPADLNRELQSFGLRFAPDPSTLDRCTIGGMHATNAWGSHAPRDGSTRDHVISADGLIGDGSELRFGPLTDDELGRKLEQDDSEGLIYRTVHGIIERNREMILARSPDPQVTNNTGYALDVLARGRPWVSDGKPFNLARLLGGAEGTLALLTRLTVKLTPMDNARGLLCLHFDAMDAAFDAVPTLMDLRPAALELLDNQLLDLTAQQPEQRDNRLWIVGAPQAVLVVEFSGERREVDDRTTQCSALAERLPGHYATADIEPRDIDKVFALRRAALGLLMGRPGRRKTATVIEDSAVPVPVLGEYIVEVRKLMQRLDVECMYYGSVSRGLVHLRPWLDLSDAGDLRKFAALPNALSEIVSRYRGAFSTKHGDGRLRAPWLESIYGSEIVALFRQLKHAFDPHNILNPGKILDPPPLTENLRRVPAVTKTQTGLRWPEGWQQALRRCNGAGACRKSTGSMCPSYMATGDETYSTRGRANLLRLAAANAAQPPAIDAALALCLSCKACRRECPTNVDMARMKAEWLYQQRKTRGTALGHRLITRFASLSRVASRAPRLANAMLALKLSRRCLGVDVRRNLPSLHKQRFGAWLARRSSNTGGTPVVLLNDPHTEYYEPVIGRAAVQVLERLGYRPIITPCVSSGRVEISQGALDKARESVEYTLRCIARLGAADDVPVIGLEPSELLTLRDEAGALCAPGQRESVAALAQRAVLLDEFLARCSMPEPEQRGSALVHAHCHQKALGDPHASQTALMALDWRSKTIDGPCCGMAGFFGYQHYDVSMAVGDLAVFPAVRAASDNTTIVANGASCRQQILHATGRRALHIAQAVAAALGINDRD
ncbi:MAG: FAD-binding protein [Gammaproteobacteria bacterium]|nr:FAD-binding protein [Gammaproteobacteria bacterium]